MKSNLTVHELVSARRVAESEIAKAIVESLKKFSDATGAEPSSLSVSFLTTTDSSGNVVAFCVSDVRIGVSFDGVPL